MDLEIGTAGGAGERALLGKKAPGSWEEEEEEEEERCWPLPGGIPEFQESGDPRGASKAHPNWNVFLLRGKIPGRESGDLNSWEKGINCSKLP